MIPAPVYYRNRSYRRAAFFKQGAVFLTALLLLLSIWFVNYLVGMHLRSFAVWVAGGILGPGGANAYSMLCSTMPPLRAQQGGQNLPPGDFASLLAGEVWHVVGLDRQDPYKIVENEIPALTAPAASPTVPVVEEKVSPTPDVEEVPTKDTTAALPNEALVAIYNTHTGETYALTDGVERLQGKKGGVVQVAAALEEVLEEKYGIRVERSEAIHDEIYNLSYSKSKLTLEKLLDENPRLVAIFDIHRDAGKTREESVVTIEGRKAAPVLIVVGSDARASFPGWRKNYALAQKIETEINERFPGLCLGVRVKEGRYNQFLHPGTLLLEVGSVNNYTGEALYSARLLGEALGPLIIEMAQENNENNMENAGQNKNETLSNQGGVAP